MSTPNYYGSSAQVRVQHSDKAVLEYLARYLSFHRGASVSIGDVVGEALDAYLAKHPTLAHEADKARQAVQA